MMTSFQAKVEEGGKVRWLNPRLAIDVFRQLEGKRITIIVEDPARGQDMNRLLHAIFQEFSRRTGYSPAASKEFLKQQFIEDGRGTAELSEEEAGAFAEFCGAWMAEKLD